ncbi:MAG TPA: hypothetical protein VIS03_12395 [Kiloniellaceae bacterium]
MLFDPALITRHEPLAQGSALRRFLTRLGLFLCLAVGLGAALLLFAPLL